jgi:hypothetical protein
MLSPGPFLFPQTQGAQFQQTAIQVPRSGRPFYASTQADMTKAEWGGVVVDGMGWTASTQVPRYLGWYWYVPHT